MNSKQSELTLEELYLEHKRLGVSNEQTIRTASILFPDKLEDLHKMLNEGVTANAAN